MIELARIEKIRFKNYKSFGNEWASIDNKRINILIGRNNSGKSSCLDIIENIYNKDKLNEFLVNGGTIQIDTSFSKEEYDEILTEHIRNVCSISSGNVDDYINDFISYILSTGIIHNPTHFELTPIYSAKLSNNKKVDWNKLQKHIERIINKTIVLRINAERDIVPEKYNGKEDLSENGTGATNLINQILNDEKSDESIIKNDLLKALNSIISPDSHFDDITVQRSDHLENSLWEIFLYENQKRYPLSKMGSGLKTIILVLLNLLVILKNRKYNDKYLIFAFEELENNLHPALQRRLFDYLYRFIMSNDNYYLFLTTHSHVAINAFSDKEETQLLHILKDENGSHVHSINDFFAKKSVLDDLDVRASDLYQSNGIIWVEGPSDRIYVKRWIELWGDDDIVEGADYQFLYYGGRLLSHYSADIDTNIDGMLDILLTNTNSAIIIDSDKKKAADEINDTKKRIKTEFEKAGLFCWITLGKEIENYVPYQAINSAFPAFSLDKQCKQYQLFPNYILPFNKSFSSQKVWFAQKVAPHITSENAENILDVKEQIIALCKEIRKWNHK